jgi:tryptophanyl-tRNA synthetase
VVDTLAPVRERYLQLIAQPDHVRGVVRAGAERARATASDKVRQAQSAIGLLPT